MFEIKPATRQGIKPLIGFYGESGTGKTMSALLFARGLAGENGRVVLIDSESGRGSLYADVIQGGYDTLELREPFSPSHYIEAIKSVEQSGASVLVIDSASHEWEGLSGVTDMAMQISKSRAEKYNKDWDGVVQFGDWKQPKMEHQKFMLKMLQSSLSIIVCLRAKYKTRQQKDEKGKTAIVKDEFTSPIQADDFIFEMTCHAEILQNHSIILTKCSHPSLRDCFPKDKTTPITVEHGKILAAWCNAAGKPATTPQPNPEPQSEAREIAKTKLEVWNILKKEIGDSITPKSANEYLWANEILDAANPDHELSKLGLDALKSILAKIK